MHAPTHHRLHARWVPEARDPCDRRSPGLNLNESAQFVCGCREVGEGTGDCPHVVVEHVPVDVVDVVASLVVAAVIGLAGLPAPGFGLLGRLLLIVAAICAANRDARLDEG